MTEMTNIFLCVCADERCHRFRAALGLFCQSGDFRFILRSQPGSGSPQRVSRLSPHKNLPPYRRNYISFKYVKSDVKSDEPEKMFHLCKSVEA